MNDSRQASIVISNYNYGRFLREAIDSALGQTYANTEVIVVDDGSTDESREIIASYGQRITSVLKKNGGQASAFNAGFAVSRGDVIFFLDADDMLLPTALERARPLFDSAEVVKVHWPLIVIDEFSHRKGRLYPNQPPDAGSLLNHVLHHGPNSYVSPPTSGNAWARWFLEEVFPVPECGDKHGADAYLFALAPIFGRIKGNLKPESYYRVHETNFSGQSVMQRITHDLKRYDHHCRLMSHYLRRKGLNADPAAWKGPHTVYAWMKGVQIGMEEITRLLPDEDTFILVDECQWGSGQVVEGRRCIPFLERDGQYWGPPPDDATAVSELERLRRCGAGFIVFGWPAFWWLDYYVGLSRHLRSEFRCLAENERLVAFDLRQVN